MTSFQQYCAMWMNFIGPLMWGILAAAGIITIIIIWLEGD